MDWLLACEAKSTVFEAARDKARRTQMGGKRRRIKGNLRRLSQSGVERVAFLHLSGTNPRQSAGGFAWMVAFEDAARGREVVGPVFRPGELPPHVGHYSTIIGALPDVDGMVRKLEHAGGSGGLLEIRQPGAPNPAAAWQPWRDQFRTRLGRVPVPQYSPVFIKACLVCNTWGRFYSAVEECLHPADPAKAP